MTQKTAWFLLHRIRLAMQSDDEGGKLDGPVEIDENSYLRATVTYSDVFGSGKNAQARSEHEVHEMHPSNHAPEFPSTETGTRSIDENSPPGTNIGAPVAVSDDERADVLTYDLDGADADSFDLERTTGQLLTNAPLNHEARTIYNVIVTVTDPSLVTANQSVTIAITNVEEPGIATLSTPTPGEGERVDAVFEDPDGGVTDDSWAWARSAAGSTNWTVITGQVSSNYVATSDDIGHYLRATVFYTDAQGSGKEAEAVWQPVYGRRSTGGTPVTRGRGA